MRPELKSSHLSINEQIDDIFSQLTEEIYLDEKIVKQESEKKVKEDKIKLSRSPTRNRFDPLPPPPTSSSTQPPPPIDRLKKPTSPAKNISSSQPKNISSKYKRPANERQVNKTLTNEKPRAKTTSVTKSETRRNHSLPHDKQKVTGDAVVYEDQDIPNTLEKIVVDVHNVSPPPMPEKQKIHLKNSLDRGKETSKSFVQKSNISSQEAAMIQELKEKVTDKQGKISKFDKPRTRSYQRGNNSGKIDQSELSISSRDKNSSNQSRDQQKLTNQSRTNSSSRTGQYETMTGHTGVAERNIFHQRREDYRRSRSMGPLESRERQSKLTNQSRERQQLTNQSRERQLRQRSKSRGYDPSPDRSRLSGERARSRGGRHESFTERGRDILTNQSRDRQNLTNQSRDGRHRSNVVSPPSAAQAQETIASLLPRYHVHDHHHDSCLL